MKNERSHLKNIRNEMVNELVVRGWGHWSNEIEVETITEGYIVKLTVHCHSSNTIKVDKSFSRRKDPSRIAHQMGEALQKQLTKINV